MNRIMILVLALSITGCACARGHKASEKQLRQALADTNVALGEAQDRAAARQAQAERLARKLYRHKHS